MSATLAEPKNVVGGEQSRYGKDMSMCSVEEYASVEHAAVKLS